MTVTSKLDSLVALIKRGDKKVPDGLKDATGDNDAFAILRKTFPAFNDMEKRMTELKQRASNTETKGRKDLARKLHCASSAIEQQLTQFVATVRGLGGNQQATAAKPVSAAAEAPVAQSNNISAADVPLPVADDSQEDKLERMMESPPPQVTGQHQRILRVRSDRLRRRESVASAGLTPSRASSSGQVNPMAFLSTPRGFRQASHQKLTPEQNAAAKLMFSPPVSPGVSASQRPLNKPAVSLRRAQLISKANQVAAADALKYGNGVIAVDALLQALKASQDVARSKAKIALATKNFAQVAILESEVKVYDAVMNDCKTQLTEGSSTGYSQPSSHNSDLQSKKRIAELETENKSLQQQLQTVELQSKNSEEEIARLKQALESERSACNQLRDEKSSLENTIATLNQQLAEQKQQHGSPRTHPNQETAVQDSGEATESDDEDGEFEDCVEKAPSPAPMSPATRKASKKASKKAAKLAAKLAKKQAKAAKAAQRKAKEALKRAARKEKASRPRKISLSLSKVHIAQWSPSTRKLSPLIYLPSLFCRSRRKKRRSKSKRHQQMWPQKKPRLSELSTFCVICGAVSCCCCQLLLIIA